MKSNWIIAVDMLRVLALAMAGWIGGLTVRIIVKYRKAHKRAIERGDARGILPYHVWTIGLSHLLLVVSTSFVHASRVGERPTISLAFDLVAYALAIFALTLILRFENRRVQHGDIK